MVSLERERLMASKQDKLGARIESGIHLIPEHMRDGVRNYFYHGYHPGGFLTAVLENDLMGALAKADDINRYALPKYGEFLFNFVPAGSFGSSERVDAWLASFETEAA